MDAQHTTFSQRSFLLKVYVASIAVTGTYLVLDPWLQPSRIKFYLIVVLAIAFFIGYLITRRTKHLAGSAHYYIVCCYLILFANAMVTGGIGAPGMIWFILCPLVAFLTISTLYARIWLIVIITTVVCFYLLEKILVVQAFEYRRIWYLVSYVLFFSLVFSIMKIFRREVSKKNVELNALNDLLKREQQMLRHTQQEILLQSTRVKEAEERAQHRSVRLSYYLDQLIEIKRMEELHSGSLEYAIQRILQFLQKSLSLDSVAIWHAKGDGRPLKLFRYLGNGSDIYERSLLCRQDFAEAYDMLQTGAIINGCDQTREANQLRELFQYSVGRDSMINCPYFVDGKFSGVISCRAAGRKWSPEDVIFVRAISDTVPLAFKSHLRTQQQQLLEEKQREITEINESLERKVLERTLALNERNKHLTDFSFTNAHHIRGPICRLLGLQNLLAITGDCKEVLKIASYMSVSISEIDRITRETSEKLNELMEENA